MEDNGRRTVDVGIPEAAKVNVRYFSPDNAEVMGLSVVQPTLIYDGG